MTNEIPDFVEKIEDKTNRNFKMRNVPVATIKEFKKFCTIECGGNYSVGLFQLLKIKKQYENLLPLMSQILQELQMTRQQQTQGRSLKTFND